MQPAGAVNTGGPVEQKSEQTVLAIRLRAGASDLPIVRTGSCRRK